ncbi:MAG: glycosyltransferase family 61 protein [Tumebacillaceae bacterium]
MYQPYEQDPPKTWCESTREWMRGTYGPSAKWRPLYLDIHQETSAFVAVIPKGRAWGRDGAILTPDNKLLLDLSREWLDSPAQHSVFQQKKLPPLQITAKTVAVVTHVGSPGFYHWMYDVLSRFDLLERSGTAIDAYVINRLHHPFQHETLQMLGIPPEKLIESHSQLHLQAAQLVVPSHPGNTAKWACDYLQCKLLPLAAKTSGPPPKRIYVTRNQAKWRHVRNEDEVLNLLAPHGFQTVALEALSLAEQIALFANAECIVAPHGAGLTHLTFCRPGTRVIEMFASTYLEPCYSLLSQYRELDYHPLIGQGEPLAGCQQDSNYWHGADHLVVDVDRLAKLLEGGTPF